MREILIVEDEKYIRQFKECSGDHPICSQFFKKHAPIYLPYDGVYPVDEICDATFGREIRYIISFMGPKEIEQAESLIEDLVDTYEELKVVYTVDKDAFESEENYIETLERLMSKPYVADVVRKEYYIIEPLYKLLSCNGGGWEPPSSSAEEIERLPFGFLHNKKTKILVDPEGKKYNAEAKINKLLLLLLRDHDKIVATEKLLHELEIPTHVALRVMISKIRDRFGVHIVNYNGRGYVIHTNTCDFIDS